MNGPHAKHYHMMTVMYSVVLIPHSSGSAGAGAVTVTATTPSANDDDHTNDGAFEFFCFYDVLMKNTPW